MNRYLQLFMLVNMISFFPGILCYKQSSNIIPEKYTLTIEVYFDNMTYEGEVSIEFSVSNVTNQIVLRAEKTEFKEISLKSLRSLEISEIINASAVENEGKWLLLTKEELSGEFILNISFHGNMSRTPENEGLFYGVYIDDETKKMYAAGSRWFPTIDEQQFSKTPFTAYIARDPQYSSLSSLHLQESSSLGGLEEDKLWDTFYNPNISTNKVGFIFHQLKNVTTANLSVLVRSDALDQTNTTLDLLKSIVLLAQKWFPDGINSKLNIVALPEHGPQLSVYAGLVFSREDGILFKNGISNTRDGYNLVESLVEIVVGQLLVNLESEDTKFLKGLAAYMEQKLRTQFDPTRIKSDAYYVEKLNADFTDDTNSSVCYFHLKVAGILRMIEKQPLSEEIILKVLHSMLRDSSVASDHFFSSIDEISNSSTSLPSNLSCFAIAQTWILQSGFPIVTVTVNESAITINQVSSTKNDTVWPIPLTCKCGTENMSNETQPFKLWLTEPSYHGTMNITCDWIVCDHEEGIFRMNYDPLRWRNLAEQLIRDHAAISPEQRREIINDIFYLAEHSFVNYSEVFYLTQYLINETDYLTWQTAALSFDKYIQLFYGTQLALNIQEYVNGLYSTYFSKVYRIKPLSESQIERLASQNALYWGCRWRLESCLKFTSELFKQWRSVSAGFPADYEPAALCTGVEQFPEVFLEVFDAFTQSNVEGNRLEYLKALACTNDTDNINFLLELIFMDESQTILGYNSKLNLIKYILDYPGKAGAVLRFMEKNYNTAITVVGSKAMDSLWQALERNKYIQEDICLIENMARNVSLPFNLRERISSMLIAAGTVERISNEMAPLVTAGLSQHLAAISASLGMVHCFYISYFLPTILYISK